MKTVIKKQIVSVVSSIQSVIDRKCGGPGSGVPGPCPSGGSGSQKPKKVGNWVVHPKTGRRGVIDHIYEDNKNDKGRLVQVDYGVKPNGGGIAHVNHREHDLQLSRDQTSKWASKPNEV